MSRTGPLVVLAILLVAGLAALPAASASHDWGHRFMVAGQILDSEGEPAQRMTVTASVELRSPPDAQITIQTDCMGFYYTLKQQSGAGDYGLEDAQGGARMHIHNADYAPRADYIVATPYAEYREDPLTPGGPLERDQLAEYAIHRARADQDRQSAIANIRLDVDLDLHPDCEGEDWQRTFTVVGKVQEVQGRTRNEDQFRGQPVNVTVQTADGPRSLTTQVDVTAMYVARFSNVTVPDNARITATIMDQEYTGRADSSFGVATVNLVEEPPLIGTGAWIFFGIVALLVVGAVGYWGAQRMKDRRAVEKAREGSTRKRARR